MKPFRHLIVLATAWLCVSSAAAAEEIAIPGLAKPVTVAFDAHAIPCVFAESWTDAARTLGYLHATDRLAQMEFFRRVASGTLAELAGPDMLEADKLHRLLGTRRSCQQTWDSGLLPPELREELLAYAAGVNAKLAEFVKKGLPPLVKAMGISPAPWSPVDTLAFSKYMGWDQSGTLDDLWLATVTEKVGPTVVNELWPLDRPYEAPTIKVQADAKAVSALPVHRPSAAVSRAAADALAKWSQPRLLGQDMIGSNNWAVAGSRTRSGKPILCSDPHLDLKLPSIWYACHLRVGDVSVSGVTFPIGPTVIIGATDHHAWGITNLQADAVDYFIETPDPADASKYLHRGQSKPFIKREESIAVRGQDPVKLTIEETVHGPIISREGAVISLCWTGLGPTRDAVALWGVGRARSLREFLASLRELTVPALNLCYADVEGNIAMACVGALPLRLSGAGRVPMEGASGDFDWVGMIPPDQMPLAINPPEGFVASANGRPASVGYPYYLGWMWDPSYRKRRIDERLAVAKDLTVESMAPIQLDAYDKAASRFIPVLLSSLEKARPTLSEVERRAMGALKEWDFVADQDAKGTMLWLRWLGEFRRSVWNDEWKPRGLSMKEGSWGFTSINQREPALEVLEFLTRENPQSAWFDDKSTPERETRDDIMIASFRRAVAGLVAQQGDVGPKWEWKVWNKLKLASLYGQAILDRQIGPVTGTIFTVNPGGGGGFVTSGASWRMIVDMSGPVSGVGVYPGGQSDNPLSRNNTDLANLWATGRYVPLLLGKSLDTLPPAAKTRTLKLTTANP